MHKAFGIISASNRNTYVDGLQDYRPIGAFSFLGRYRAIDFPISSMSNSNIDRIQVYCNSNPRSLIDHLGTGRHYNINSKSGRLQILFSSNSNKNDVYNTDISYYYENLESIASMNHPYVVIAPSYMVYTADFADLIQTHVESRADITLLYHSVDTAKDEFLGCDTLNLNRQKGVESITANHGSAKNKHIFMDTYVMKKDLFVELVKKAKERSSMYNLVDIINVECEELDIRGVAHKGYFAALTDFPSYVKANMDLINHGAAKDLFHEDWPIYTRTNDSSPTHYYETADVKNSVVSNGCKIEGSVENCIVGRGVVIKKGAVVKNSIIFAGSMIGEDVHMENMVVDKWAQIIHAKEVIGDAEHFGYIKRKDLV